VKTTAIPQTEIAIAELNESCGWRAKTFWTKEPATVGWLGELGPNDVLWDVGANIGLYSLFAAAKGAQAIAFEPMIPNLYALHCNLMLNQKLAERITIVPIALSDSDGFDTLFLSSPDIGSSCHAAGSPLNYKLQQKDHWHGRHGCVLMRGDKIDVAPPTRVKIDVDGFEHKVVTGLGHVATLVKSWCIEVNLSLPEHKAMVASLQQKGWDYEPAQFEAARRREGPFAGIGEMILRRA